MENKVKIYITRKKIKNMYLRVKEPDGRVEVSAPYNMKEEDIRRFIKAHEEWIQNAVLRIEEKKLFLFFSSILNLLAVMFQLSVTQCRCRGKTFCNNCSVL